MFGVIGFLESCSFALLARVLSCGLFADSALSQKSRGGVLVCDDWSQASPPALLFSWMLQRDVIDVIDVIGSIGVIGVFQFCKGPPFLLLIFWLPSFFRCKHM